jgi:hypothetical protein
MDKAELMKLGAEKLACLVLKMGHVIRILDEDSKWTECWTQDGDYISDLILTEL